MKKSQPIKNKGELDRFKYYYLHEKYNPRNHVLITMGLNTALRISDLLSLCWQDVYDFDKEKFRSHIIITETKHKKDPLSFSI